MRNSPRHAKQSIMVCVPAIDGRVGLPFAGAQAMSTAATIRGVEVLRREIRVAAATEATEAHARSMRNLKVVVVDVGHCGQPLHYFDEDAAERATIDWTASEKATYGVAFANALSGSAYASSKTNRGQRYWWSFAQTLVDVISDGTRDANGTRMSSSRLAYTWSRVRLWLRGDRFGVGAGGKSKP